METRCYDTRVRAALLPLILIAFSHFAVADEPPRGTIEEVLAVVGDTPILLSDSELSALVRLVDPETGESSEDYRTRLLDARIRLEIQFRDLEDAGLLFRLDLEPERVRGLLVARSGGRDVLEVQLSSKGLGWPDLDELALRVAAVDAYVEQRLRPRVSVTMEEIEAAYQQLLVNEIAATDETPPPLSTVQKHLRDILVEQKLNVEIESWIQRATERQEVTRFTG